MSHRSSWRGRAAALGVLLSTLVACGDNGGSSGGGRVTYTVSGVISGLTGNGLVLELNHGDDLQVGAASSAFEFTEGLTNGASYLITVKQNPASETCVIGQPSSGTVSGANIVGVAVVCTPRRFTVGGTITGLAGSGLAIQDQTSGGSADPAPGAASYTLSSTFITGQNYNVVVEHQPVNPTQSCVVSSPTGQVATSDIENVKVACTTQSYTLGGTVTNLQGSGLTLKDAVSGQTFVVQPNGLGSVPFNFASPILSGSSYQVSVIQQPTKLNQTCAVTSSNGVMGAGPVTSLAVNCVTNLYGVSGTINGPAASSTTGLVLTDTLNGTQAIISGTSFYFPYPNGGIPDGSSFNIQIQELESAYTNTNSHCLLASTGADGVIAGQNFTSVQVTCRYISAGLVAVGPGGTSSPGTLAYFLFNTISGNVGSSTTVATSDNDPTSLAVGPNGTNGSNYATVYVGNATNETISASGLSSFLYSHEGINIEMMQIEPLQSDIATSGAVSMLSVDPTDSYLYAGNADVAEISSFSIGSTDATLSNRVDNAAVGGAMNLTINAAGSFATLLSSATPGVTYLTPFYPLALNVFSRSSSSGALTEESIASALSSGGFSQTVAPAAAAFNGNDLYVLGNTYGSSGPASFVPGSAPFVVGYSLNPSSTVSLLPTSPYQTPSPIDFGTSVLLDPSGTYLFVVDESAGISAFTLNSNGSLTIVSGSPFRVDGVSGLTSPLIDPSGKFFYALANETSNIVAYRINLAPSAGTPALALIGIYPVAATTQMVMDNSGKFLYVLGSDGAGSQIAGFFIDPNSGALTPTGGSPYSFAFSVQQMAALPPSP